MSAAPAVTRQTPRPEPLRRDAAASSVESAMPHAEPSALPTMAEIHDQIEAADDVPTAMKFVLYQNEARHRDLVQEMRDGFDRQADATKEQTDTWIAFAKQAGLAVGAVFAGAFVIVVLVIVVLAQTRGVDVGETAEGVRGVTSATKELAEHGPAVAPSAP